MKRVVSIFVLLGLVGVLMSCSKINHHTGYQPESDINAVVSELEAKLGENMYKIISTLYEKKIITVPDHAKGGNKTVRVVMEIQENGDVTFFDEKGNKLEGTPIPGYQFRETKGGYSVITVGKVNTHFITKGGRTIFPAH